MLEEVRNKKAAAAERGTKNATENGVSLPEGAGQATRDTERCKDETALKPAAKISR